MANITVDTSAELDLEMEAMTSTTKALYSEFNDRYEQLLENDNALSNLVEEEITTINETLSSSSSSLNSSITTQIAALQKEIDKMNNTTQVTFKSSGWSSSAPYTQSVTLSGATSDDEPEVFIYFSSSITSSSAEAYVEAFSYINKYETGTDKITATAYYEKPSANVTVTVKGV